MKIAKTIRNTIISTIVLLVLFVGAAAAYVFITGRSNNQQPGPAKSDKPAEQSGALKPRKPAPNAKESAAVESLLSPVKRGSNSSITVKTNAGSKCKILVSYKDKAYKDSGLIDKVADDFGNVTWAWTIKPSAPTGSWLIKVTCVYNGRSAVVQGDLKVI